MAKKVVVTKSSLAHDEEFETNKGADNVNASLPKGLDITTNDNGDNVLGSKVRGRRSRFNAYHVFVSPTNTYTDEDFAQNRDKTHVTIQKLLDSKQGANKFDAIDFIYLDKFRVLPLNRLITLRRFMYPCFDDIFSASQKEPDIGRLLTYFDQENNKLDSLFNMTFGMKWKQLESSSEEASTIGDQDGASGFQKSILKFVDPKFGNESMRGPNELAYDPQHDSNKVYGPVDSIASTSIRDVGLNFEQPIKLQFHWKMKSIDGINQKAAFLDLISHILSVTTNDAKFWGGARYYKGPQPSKYAKDLRKLGNAEYIKNVNKSGQDLKSYMANAAKKLFSQENLANIAENIGNLAMGAVLDKLGRPSIPVMNSLLTGEPVGSWHLTIGNPFNPIMSLGDLILKSSTLSVPHGALNIDDFPTELILECELAHAKPRGRAEIESIFTAGRGRMYWEPDEAAKAQMLKGNLAPKSLEGDIRHGIDDAIKNLYGFTKNVK